MVLENQNNEVDLVNHLLEVLNELKEIEERNGDCDLWRTYAEYKGDFICFEKCDGVTILEAVKGVQKIVSSDAIHAWCWSDPEDGKCQEGWLADKVITKYDCESSVTGCIYD